MSKIVLFIVFFIIVKTLLIIGFYFVFQTTSLLMIDYQDIFKLSTKLINIRILKLICLLLFLKNKIYLKLHLVHKL